MCTTLEAGNLNPAQELWTISNTKILYREVVNECECIKWLFVGGEMYDLDGY